MPGSQSAPPVIPYANRTAVWIVIDSTFSLQDSFWGPDFCGDFRNGWVIASGILATIDWRRKSTKVTVILYSMTALTDGLFIFVLLATLSAV